MIPIIIVIIFASVPALFPSTYSNYPSSSLKLLLVSLLPLSFIWLPSSSSPISITTTTDNSNLKTIAIISSDMQYFDNDYDDNKKYKRNNNNKLMREIGILIKRKRKNMKLVEALIC